MFPNYADWDIAYTSSALRRQTVKRIIGYGVLVLLTVAVVISTISGYGWREPAYNILANADGYMKVVK